MTPERAIKRINGLKSITYQQETEDVCDMAIAAIERCMVAKKPRNGIGSFKTIKRCPNCNSTVINTSDHCRKCGQAIDWSDTE